MRAAVDKLAATGDARAQVLLLGMVLAALEGRTPKDAWRAAPGNYRPVPGSPARIRAVIPTLAKAPIPGTNL